MTTNYRLLLFAVCLPLCIESSSFAQTLSFAHNGDRVYGKPVAYDSKELFLLKPDGQLGRYRFSELSQPRKESSNFISLPKSALRESLDAEFGKGFQISTTKNYLVAHPKGQKSLWAHRFENVLQRVNSYVRQRGIATRSLTFPLVAIVLPNRATFEQYIKRTRDRVPSFAIAYYSPATNRVVMYDLTGGKNSKMTWTNNAETIVHETAHQAAYNLGYHSRFGFTPVWMAEGFATMFEAKGVWAPTSKTRKRDRLNHGLLNIYQKKLANSKGWVGDLVVSDRMFKSDAKKAYAGAWALSFYLCYNKPHQYFNYMKHTSKSKLLSQPTPAQRLATFNAYFGNDLGLFEAKIKKYFEVF